jgi:hypothetical protein
MHLLKNARVFFPNEIFRNFRYINSIFVLEIRTEGKDRSAILIRLIMLYPKERIDSYITDVAIENDSEGLEDKQRANQGLEHLFEC